MSRQQVLFKTERKHNNKKEKEKCTMKTVYIPKGETVRYESLVTDRLVVRGCVDVAGDIRAKTICGDGIIHAGTVHADIIRADEVETAEAICRRLIAKRVQTPALIVSDCAVVSCFLSASYVETGKLTVATSEIDQLKANEVVNLGPRTHGLLLTLLAAGLRSLWVSLTAPRPKQEETAGQAPAEDDPEEEADLDPTVREEIARTVREILEQDRAAQREASPEDGEDFELKRIVSMFKLLREQGYTLRVLPGTPEENAPAFDLETKTILRPAA